MTGISHLNILVQQGGKAQELHQMKQQSAEHTQTVVAQDQMARNVEASVRVPVAEESERSYPKRSASKEKKGGGRPSGEEKKKKENTEEKPSTSTGKLLDTVA